MSDTKYGLYAVCFGFFLVLLDTTALNVAIVAMQREFGGSVSGLQWVVNSYTIVFASFLLTCGAIGDRFGARLCYQVGLLLFTAMSGLCALSPEIGFLIGARCFQGLGAAIMLPASLSLLTHTFPDPQDRARAVSFWAGVVSLGFAAGPALGGLLTSLVGWRSIFWINVPIGAGALLMVRAFVAEARVDNPRRIDWIGQTAIAACLFCLSYGLIDAGRDGWSAFPVLTAFAAAGLLALVFWFVERRSSFPVLPGVLFANSTFSVSVASGVVLNFCMYGTLFIESIYLQEVRHLSPLATGLMILPFTVLPTITTRLIVAWNGRQFLKPRLFIGQLVGVSGAVVLGVSLRTPGYGMILLGLGLFGVAMGCIMPAMTAGVLISSSPETSGLASGILNSGRQVGGTLGVALMGTLVQSLHDRGLELSFAAIFLIFALMAVATRWSME